MMRRPSVAAAEDTLSGTSLRSSLVMTPWPPTQSSASHRFSKETCAPVTPTYAASIDTPDFWLASVTARRIAWAVASASETSPLRRPSHGTVLCASTWTLFGPDLRPTMAHTFVVPTSTAANVVSA